MGVNYRYTENPIRPLKIGDDAMSILHRVSDTLKKISTSASTKLHHQVRSKYITEIEHEPEPEQHQATSERNATYMGKCAERGSSSSARGSI